MLHRNLPVALHHVLGRVLKVGGLLKVAAISRLHMDIFPLYRRMQELRVGVRQTGLVRCRQDVLLIDWLLPYFLPRWILGDVVDHDLHGVVGLADVLLQVPVLQVGLATASAHKGFDAHVKVLVCLEGAACGEVLAAYIALMWGHTRVGHFMRHQLGLLREALHMQTAYLIFTYSCAKIQLV